LNKADLKAEEAEKRVQDLEKELAEKEQLHEELGEKYKSMKNELDELTRQFEEM
jgi:tropomyosin